MTITLERPIASTTDMLVYSAVNWVNIDPYPVNCKKIAIAFSTSSNQAIDIPYIKLVADDPGSPNQAVNKHRQQTNSVFLSPWMRIPPDAPDN